MTSNAYRAKLASDAPNRALTLALRSPIAAVTALRSALPPSSVTRHGQRATPVPMSRFGKPTK